MKTFIIILSLILSLTFVNYSYSADGFTQRDRELLIELKTKMVEIDKRFEQIDKRFEQVDKRFEQMMSFMWMLAGIFTALVCAVIGFALWDRRTMIRPFESKTKEIEKKIEDIANMDKAERERLTNLISAFRDLAKADINVANVLKKFNLF